MTTIVWDYDYIKYTIGAIAEKRSIKVINKQSGDEMDFKTRTEFWGHHAKKAGGFLAEMNKGRVEEGKEPFKPEDFTIEDVQTPEPESYALRAVKTHIESVIAKLDATNYYGYIGVGDSWRVEASTILKYKGSRSNAIKPFHLEAIENYLRKQHGATNIAGLEVDDQVVIDCTEDPSLILVGVDKDYRGCKLTLFNPDKMGEPEKIEGFGRLYIGSDKEVRGEGRIWLLHQVLSGDSSDEYCANSASDVRWGDKSSFAVLSKCNNDKDAWQGVVDAYKKLYPEPKIITGWRGDKIEVDWKYVLQENLTMAHMLRHENDYLKVGNILDKLKVSY